jgi:hypothetical protein
MLTEGKCTVCPYLWVGMQLLFTGEKKGKIKDQTTSSQSSNVQGQ